MSVDQSLRRIREVWLSRVSRNLARGEDVRESFLIQLNQFYDNILRAAETGDPAWLDPTLERWITGRTQNETKDWKSYLLPILEQVFLVLFETAQEMLENHKAVHLFSSLIPIYTHAVDYSTQREANIHLENAARESELILDSLEQLDKSKSDFIAIAAHELKTPLTLIEGYTDMLRDNLSHDELENESLLLKGIDNGTRRLREIVNDMIDVSLIDNNLLSLNFQPVRLYKLFKSLQKDFLRIVEGRQQTLEINPFPGCQEMIYADEERLYQVFRNLISNAIKYTPDGGQISINGRSLPGFIEVTVTDDGIGIDPKDHNRIFDKFGNLGSASLHSSSKSKYKGGGPGLGLAIARGIIEAHGGTIWVESDGYDESECPGTTFHIILPDRKTPPNGKSVKTFASSLEASKDVFVDAPPPTTRSDK